MKIYEIISQCHPDDLAGMVFYCPQNDQNELHDEVQKGNFACSPRGHCRPCNSGVQRLKKRRPLVNPTGCKKSIRTYLTRLMSKCIYHYRINRLYAKLMKRWHSVISGSRKERYIFPDRKNFAIWEVHFKPKIQFLFRIAYFFSHRLKAISF